MKITSNIKWENTKKLEKKFLKIIFLYLWNFLNNISTKQQNMRNILYYHTNTINAAETKKNRKTLSGGSRL